MFFHTDLVRLKVAGVHWLASLLVVSGVAALVFCVWYPYPFQILAGGGGLFWLLISVDLILGPLLTLVVFSPKKSRRALVFDLFFIVILQLLALGYGLHTIYSARPVFLVHEVDRFQVIVAADVNELDLNGALAEFQKLPRWGLRLIGVRSARDGTEALASVEMALAGRDVALRPDWWVPLSDEHRAVMRKRALVWSELRVRSAQASQQIDQLLHKSGLPERDAIALPLVNRHQVWTIVLRRDDASVVGYLPIDSL